MKRFVCLAMIICLCAAALPASASETGAADYTTAGKLLKQLWAGSGFSGTLKLEITRKDSAEGEAVTSKKPLEAALDYIYVRATDGKADEHRLDLTLPSDNASAHLSLKNGALAFKSELTGADWYSLPASTSLHRAETSALPIEGADEKAGELLGMTGMPALVKYLLPAAVKAQGESQELTDAMEPYMTRIDLWIEGYRQSAAIGKLEDGTNTMTTSYALPPAAIKAQAKQLVLDLLGDGNMLALLASALDDDAAVLLNPELQSYYFDAIDDLPLEGDMTIERKVSMKGDTLELHISLPLYDAESGASTLKYDRVRGEGDLPDTNVVSLTGAARETTLSYQTYESMANVTVLQGTLTGGATDEAGAEGERSIAVSFTLTMKQTEGRDEQDRDTLDYEIGLTLEPYAEAEVIGKPIVFDPLELKLDALFASKTLKTASTDMLATLTVDGEKRANIITITLDGKTRKKWTPEALPETVKDVRDLTESEIGAMLPEIAMRGSLLIAGYFNIPEPQSTIAPAETDAATVAPEATPETFETLAPGETLTDNE